MVWPPEMNVENPLEKQVYRARKLMRMIGLTLLDINDEDSQATLDPMAYVSA